MNSFPHIQSETQKRPLKILQFGQGNFLRAYLDWMFERLNRETDFNAGVHILQPMAPKAGLTLEKLREQKHLYTVLLRGLKNGKPFVSKDIIECVIGSSNATSEWIEVLKCAESESLRFIVSNTTESGIVYQEESYSPSQCPKTFPAKVASLLYHRYKTFSGDSSKGLLFLPCELIENNGQQLKNIILKYAEDWRLEVGFTQWVHESNHFANTLVDRIVPGFPSDEIESISKDLGYRDDLLVCGELYHLLAIDGDEIFQKELPFDQTNMNVIFTHDLAKYRSRKVKVLNGIHSMSVLLAHLMGVDTVREMIEHPELHRFINKASLEEISPTIDMDELEKSDYIKSVMERFANPYIHHLCMSISLNSISKFKVRVLPTLLEYIDIKGKAPSCLTFSFAALIQFYKVTHRDDGKYFGMNHHRPYQIQDSSEQLERMKSIWSYHHDDLGELVHTILAESSFWDEDLSRFPDLSEQIRSHLCSIHQHGASEALNQLLSSQES
jgi:tagaturonate reductase